MALGVTVESLRDMSPGGLRELLSIAQAMVAQTTIDALRPEYQALAEMVETELREREVAAATAIQTAIREIHERDRNRAADNDRIAGAKKRLAEAGIDINVDPKLISPARLYHLSTVVEALEAVSSKNPYLTKHASKKVGKSQLPSRALKQEFASAQATVDQAMGDIRKLADDRVEAIRQADRVARTVAIPAKFRQNGALVDHGTFLYPGAGSVVYNAARTYLLAPNRTLVHVKDELSAGATPQLAGHYLAALVAGCTQFIDDGGCDRHEQEKLKVYGFSPSGTRFFWSMIGKKKASMQGFAGEIFHVDSGYTNSRWRQER
jgi:hypothetical protein